MAGSGNEFGYQSPLTPRAVYRTGIAAVDTRYRRMFGNHYFSELPATTQDSVPTGLEKNSIQYLTDQELVAIAEYLK